MQRNKIAAWALAGVVSIGGMMAVTNAEAACTLGATYPTRSGDNVYGQGVRGTTCTTSATVTATIRRQVSLAPDVEIGRNSTSGVNFTTYVTGSTGGGTHSFRTTASSSGGSSAQSPWVSLAP